MQTELLLEADSSSSPFKSANGPTLDGALRKTSPVCSAVMEGGILLRWLESWLGAKSVFQKVAGEMPVWRAGQKDSSNGSLWMHNTCEWNPSLAPSLKDDGVCSLSEILETGRIDRRYFLSPKACRGILRRAEKRGKELPPHLRTALEAVAGMEPTSSAGGGLIPEVVGTINDGAHFGGGRTDRTPTLDASSIPEVAWALQERDAKGSDSSTKEGHLIPMRQGGSFDDVAHSLKAEGADASEDGTGRGTPLVAFDCKAGGNTSFAAGDVPGALRGEGNGGGHAAIAFIRNEGAACTVDGTGAQSAATQWAIRRLTEIECERLFGMADDWTNTPSAKGRPRYRAIGNSIALNCLILIGERIAKLHTP